MKTPGVTLPSDIASDTENRLSSSNVAGLTAKTRVCSAHVELKSSATISVLRPASRSAWNGSPSSAAIGISAFTA